MTGNPPFPGVSPGRIRFPRLLLEAEDRSTRTARTLRLSTVPGADEGDPLEAT
jgi:hypothetical protein